MSASTGLQGPSPSKGSEREKHTQTVCYRTSQSYHMGRAFGSSNMFQLMCSRLPITPNIRSPASSHQHPNTIGQPTASPNTTQLRRQHPTRNTTSRQHPPHTGNAPNPEPSGHCAAGMDLSENNPENTHEKSPTKHPQKHSRKNTPKINVQRNQS